MNNEMNALNRILQMFSADSIGLPKHNAVSEIESELAHKVILSLDNELGLIAEENYYKCSRERFYYIVYLAIKYLPKNANVLDIGNAPGYLALGLHNCGFKINGINLSDSWNTTYPSQELIKTFNVKSLDVENNLLSYDDESFDSIVFTEVLEHIAIKNPREILIEFYRVLKPGGTVLFTTPNVCNISNVLALLSGINIFWPTSMFYGSTDRHNREFTPNEVRELFSESGFAAIEFFGMCDHANWRIGTAEKIYEFLATQPSDHDLLRNTIVGVFRKI
jgi:2-polyprenyl-3-methyl-5-hydroxy-6-metoxy-1,4-benzoquinol methylase